VNRRLGFEPVSEPDALIAVLLFVRHVEAIAVAVGIAYQVRDRRP